VAVLYTRSISALSVFASFRSSSTRTAVPMSVIFENSLQQGQKEKMV